VFQNATLRAIAMARPASLAELSEINGVGEAKLAKYGEQVLDLLAGVNEP
jgi:ATP-dependent DNA helicase RecQ